MTMVHGTSAFAPRRGLRLPAIGGIDPRIRIVMTGFFAVATVSLAQIPPLLVSLTIAVWMLRASHLPMRRTLRQVATMDSFLILMIFLLPFTTPGTPMLTLFGFAASWEGLHLAIVITLKANAVMIAALALLTTMEVTTLGQALRALRVPTALVHLMLFTLRYIDVLGTESRRLRTAMRARGFRPGTNMHTYRSYGYLVGMMVIRALDRSERIMDAMKCRGFAGRLPLLEMFRTTAGDWVALTGLAFGLAGLLVWDLSLAV
ncbi:MAG: cobalt ECF transporter T component CbiQ [Pseudomonadota bacterium]